MATLGSLLGLGGGSILVPVLLLLFQEASPGTISSISLTVVFIVAASATMGNLRAGRIDARSAFILGAGSIPAAVAGALATSNVSRSSFVLLFGVMLLLGSLYVLWRSTRPVPFHPSDHDPNREIHERKGSAHKFYVSTLLLGIVGPLGGFIGSFFGIGGGVIHVPALTFLLKMPPRVVNATALFVVVPTSGVALLTRVLMGEYLDGWVQAGLLGLGALVGAQMGVYLLSRVNQRVVVVTLSVVMILVAARQILAGV
ncbi:MAG: sulfite exporter TauE/SafE family protein [Chloroflexi bacterium]|nr:sulfite exporter TauE/SafE family protein [Chloroflexota bacterium]